MGKLDKPIAPSKNAPRSLWLQYWKEVKEWAQKDMKVLQHGIDRDIELVREAQKRIKKLKDKLELETVDWNGKYEVPHYTKEILVAQGYGLYITATKGRPGVHSPTSYHYQGPNYAVDMGASSVSLMIRAQNALLKRFGPGHFKELFGPDGWYVKNGVKYQGAFPAHGDHIHFAA